MSARAERVVLGGVRRTTRQAVRRMGLVELAEGRVHDAVETLRMAVLIDPGDGRALRDYAGALERAGDVERAEALCVLACSLEAVAP